VFLGQAVLALKLASRMLALRAILILERGWVRRTSRRTEAMSGSL